MTMSKFKTIEWYARGGGIAKMGPYTSQARASAALLTPEGVPIEGAFVWPVEVSARKVGG